MFRDRLFMPADGDPAAGGGGGGAEGAKPPEFVSVTDFSSTTGALNSKLRKVETALTDMSGKTLTRDSLFESLAEAGLLVKDGDKYKPAHAAAAPPAKKDPAEPDPRVTALERQIQDLTRQTKAKDDALQAERDKSAATLRKTAVVAALQTAGAHRPDRDYVHLLDAVKVDESGHYFVPGKDKYENEIQIPLSEYAAKYLADNPELRAASGKPGSGTPAANGTPGQPRNGVTVIPHSQYTDMEWYGKNKDKFRTGEYIMGPSPRESRAMGVAPGQN